jgi:subtilisin family serine protease
MVRMIAFLLAFAVATPAFAGPLLRTNGQRVDGEYLVAFKNPFAMQAAATQMRGMGIEINDMWEAVNGASVRMTADQLDAVLRMDSVAWVEESSLYYIASNPAPRTIPAAQRTGLYGIDQIDSPTAVQNGIYDPSVGGAGVDVYVIDTGIRPTHTQFTGRFVRGTSTINDGQVNDCNLHGTHVSGTATGATFGVAAQAIITDVRVFSCAGSTTNAAIINGINFVIGRETARAPRRAVANMSLGGGASPMLDQAVNRMVAGGTFTAVAAGNSNVNAATTSPARAASAFAVGATTINRTRASFSNFGTTVKIFAPGQNILSAAFESNTGTRTISGTSMASPHVAGAAALFLELFPNDTPGQTGQRLIQAAATNRLTGNLGAGSPNRFLQVPR